ncbi:MAG: tetratricopeptide repeat protein [Chloroflexi bacterium]|nr:MAG: tetratricopeptide repeat protein [Chloroflexota bacterium]
MQRKRLLFAVTLLAILLSILVMVVPGSHAMARNTISIETPTATPDANQILNQANTVATQADHTATEAQNTLTVLNFVLALFSVIIGILGLASGALVAYAFRVINRYRKQLDEGQAEMVKMRTAMNNTQKAVVYLGLGDRLYNQDRKQEAVAIYRKAGSLLPGDAEIHNVLGRIYSGTGYYEDAIKSFETTLAADPNFAEAHMEIGLAYRRQGDAQKGPDAETLRKADYDKARIHLKRAIDLRPNYEDALAALGAVYRRMGDDERLSQHDAKVRECYEQAREYYRRAQIADPSSSYALGNVASLSWFLGEKNAANNYFTLAEAVARIRIMNAGRSPEIYWDYYDLALAQLVSGTVDKSETTKDEAIESYKTAIHLTPGIVQFDSVLNNLYLLQKAQERIHRLDTVISMLEAAKSK